MDTYSLSNICVLFLSGAIIRVAFQINTALPLEHLIDQESLIFVMEVTF